MRKANWMTSVVGAAIVMAMGVGAAHAQSTCTDTEFTSKSGELYLKAETALFQDKNYPQALQFLNQLKALELNCYERGAALRLSAAAKIEQKDMRGAVADLEQAIRIGAIPQGQLQSTYYSIAQLYLQSDNVVKAKEYMERWLRTGVRPTRDQYFQLAVIFQKLDDYRGALPHAEKVLQMDGANAKPQIIDFLIFLYDRTGDRAKKAQLLERKLRMDPTNKDVWLAISGEYYQGGDERKAFEVQKAMYLAGFLKTEDELMRIVNFYNRFNAPYEAASVLEKEINAGRISDSFDKLELLANLYQVAREYDKAIPIIQRAAAKTNDGKMDERLGRSYFELRQYQKAIDAFKTALRKGNLKEPGYANILIGQSYYELDNKSEARASFNEAQKFTDGRRAGRGWIQFLDAEIRTALEYKIFQANVKAEGYKNEKKGCDRLIILGQNLPESCEGIDEKIAAADEELTSLVAQRT